MNLHQHGQRHLRVQRGHSTPEPARASWLTDRTSPRPGADRSLVRFLSAFFLDFFLATAFFFFAPSEVAAPSQSHEAFQKTPRSPSSSSVGSKIETCRAHKCMQNVIKCLVLAKCVRWPKAVDQALRFPQRGVKYSAAGLPLFGRICFKPLRLLLQVLGRSAKTRSKMCVNQWSVPEKNKHCS